ncbi:helix-turn-helix domain-containing protein [Faucicola boevrei]|uniref:helix-turn-helix domain-containing protein n=1 Tax=Faucicola boevrei TaxID=346665 RepID=UPI00037C047E|nr:helix-turn-helix transcriptional regulator [Moraxella boevrei]
MKNLRLSVHSQEHLALRTLLINRRLELNLSQRALATKLDVVYSFVGKVETGDRRLDIFELSVYCQALELDIQDLIVQLKKQNYIK